MTLVEDDTKYAWPCSFDEKKKWKLGHKGIISHDDYDKI